MEDVVDEPKDEVAIDVGKQIRLLREQRKFTQKGLAEASGLSRNTLSLIERGQTSPTVSTLKSLAKALSIDINAFFQPFEQTSIVYTKAESRPHLLLDHGALADLGIGMQEQLLTPLQLQLEPGARSGPPVSHDGQDFIFCLRGEILYMVNGHGYVLAAGDSLLFDGRLAHRFLNPGTEVASLLIILSTPHDSSQYINAHFNNHN